MEKIRKQWLVMLVLMTGMSIVHQIIAFQFDPAISGMPKFYALLFSCGGMVAFTYWFYHCAYKKRGTKFLTFFLILSPLSFAFSGALYLLGIVPFKNYFPFYWVLTGVSSIMGVVMFVLNWKMRKLNASDSKAQA